MDIKPEVRSHPPLTADDRLYLIQTLNALPPTQFDELVYALNPPSGVIPGDSAPQGKQAKALLDWIESPSGCGLQKLDEILIKLVKPTPQAASQYLAFTIKGRIETLAFSELDEVVQYLREVTGDDSINLSFYGEGSIKLVLTGSEQGLERLQELFNAGELTAVPGDRPVESVGLMDNDTTAARKTRLIEAIRLSASNSFYGARDRDRTLDHALDLARAYTLDLGVALDRTRALDRVLDRTRALDRVLDLARDLALNLDRALDRVLHLALDRTRALDPDRTRVLHLYRALDIALDLYRARDRILYRDRFLYLALDLYRNLALDLYLVLDRARNVGHLDISELDLSGANLKSLVLIGADLTRTNLDNALVEGTVFGNNPGLTEADKGDLQRRGAIFQDSPGSDVAAPVPVPSGR